VAKLREHSDSGPDSTTGETWQIMRALLSLPRESWRRYLEGRKDKRNNGGAKGIKEGRKEGRRVF
jgi:hypothetical protein